jgi:hypothetical protein
VLEGNVKTFEVFCGLAQGRDCSEVIVDVAGWY